jgi:hypothetical protein
MWCLTIYKKPKSERFGPPKPPLMRQLVYDDAALLVVTICECMPDITLGMSLTNPYGKS